MNNSMISSAVSIRALQQKLDMLADNVANVNTVGYKRKTSVFEDILTSIQPHEKDFQLAGRRTPPGFTLGWGTRLAGMMLDMTQGSLQETGNRGDVALEGNALFRIGMPDGTEAYTRNGSFQMTPLPDGSTQLVTAGGLPVLDADGNAIIIPQGLRLTIRTDGSMAGEDANGSVVELGQIGLVRTLKPELLQTIGENLYGVSAGMDPAVVVELLPARPEGVSVWQGYTEQSNVNLTNEMAELIAVQRAYQLNTRALSSSDQMMNMANNLRG
jgi:flagellar basal-body rod protein FlgG